MFHSGNVRFFDELKPLMKPIDSFQQHPENYNNGDVDAIMESIEVNGVWRPMTVQASTGYIAIGNHEWEALKMLGVTEAPFVVEEMSDAETIRVMMADNKTAKLARPDISAELALLERLQDTDLDVQGTGYRPEDVDAIRLINEMQPDYGDHASWPTLCFRVPPHIQEAFYDMTREAIDEREKFELLLRLAGWQR